MAERSQNGSVSSRDCPSATDPILTFNAPTLNKIAIRPLVKFHIKKGKDRE